MTTALPARRPCAGAVPGRWGACLTVRTPPAARSSTTWNGRDLVERVGLVDPPGGAAPDRDDGAAGVRVPAAVRPRGELDVREVDVGQPPGLDHHAPVLGLVHGV